MPDLHRRMLAGAVAAIAVAVAATACGAPASTPGPRAGGPATIRVPQDAKTVSAAAGQARQGDLILVSPGVYPETVHIATPRVTLRGTSRSGVVIDGQLRRANGVVVTAPGVTVENLTVRNHTLNGVLVTGLTQDGGLARGSAGYDHLDPAAFPPLQGFRVSYVTASDNGLYGIYAFDAQHGTISDNYASGSADSGLYVGQCKPCDIVVRRNVAERNAVGYEGTNASEKMYVVGNRFSRNRVGLTSNSDYQEAFVPQTRATIAGNLVVANADPASPAQADGGFGLGLGIAGGTGNTVLRNRIAGNPRVGLALASAADLAPIGNQIRDNVVTGNGVDVAYLASSRAQGSKNCFQGNEIGTTLPAGLVTMMPCPNGGGGPGAQAPPFDAPPGVPFSEVPAPPAQPDLPEAAATPPSPAIGLPEPIDLNSVRLPELSLLAERSLK